MPKVSVIIPVHNGALFVSKAIRSALDQTFRDLELIVVDDGSIDETAKVIRELADPRIIYFYQSNQGPSAARNNGIRQAKGELLAFLDSDDWWFSRKLEMQLERLKTAREAGLVYCSTLKVDLSGRLLKSRPARIEGRILELLLKNNDIAGPSSVVVPRGVFEKVGFFDESLWRAEDWDMWLRIASKYPIVAAIEPLACITYRPTSHGRDITAMRDASLSMLEKAFGSYASHLIHLQSKAQANVYFMGAVRFATMGALRDSRHEFLRSLRLYPCRLSTYWRLALTFFGHSFNRRARGVKEAIRLRIVRRRRIRGGMIAGIDEREVRDA